MELCAVELEDGKVVEDACREGGKVVSIEDEEERGANDAWVVVVGRA